MTLEQATAIWTLYCEANELRFALTAYEPNVRRGLPSFAVTELVSEARALMLTREAMASDDDRERISNTYQSVMQDRP